MKPEQFICEFGEKKAREVVEGAPEGATHYELNVDGDFYFKYQGFEWFCLADGLMVRTYMEDHETCHLICLGELERLVDSLELLDRFDGLEGAKSYVPDGYKSNLLKQAIRDHESIYGGGDE